MIHSSNILQQEIPYPSDPMTLCALLAEHESCFFLDSGSGYGRLGRWSFLGADPFTTFKSKGDKITIRKDGKQTVTRGDPFAALDELLGAWSLPANPEFPPFYGGAVGYFGYDLGNFVEELPSLRPDDIGAPDACFGFYDVVIVLDHEEKHAWVISTGLPETDTNARKLRAAARLEEMLALVNGKPKTRKSDYSIESPSVTSNFEEADYRRAILRVKEYIAAGDIYQVNLSQRFSAPLAIPPVELYRRLRRINPAPFAAFLHFPEVTVASSSPERFLRFSGDHVETRPIKGTRPRGKDPESDAALRAELLSSTKDRAELVMIIDLERNDLGRFCDYGSVKVPELIVCEEYPTVFHLVSTVVGRVAPGWSRIECIKSCFPGGSITGAPKIRSMEIIEELEPVKRGIYTGAIGYLGFNGEVDLNIVIRTFVLRNGMAYFQAGGGIVADSDPGAEYQETLHKARALFRAINAVGVTG